MDTTKGLLEGIGKKFIKFDMNEKHRYLDLLNNTKYDGVKGVRDHIMLLSSYYDKLKGLKMDIREEFLTYSIMKSLPSQFDNIRSSLNTKKKGNILMIETNIIDVPMNTWWLDTRATIHVTNLLHGMISQRGPTNHNNMLVWEIALKRM